MIDKKIIEDGFWISDENSKEGLGVKIVLIQENNGDKIESIEIQVIDHYHNDTVIDGEIEIFKVEFRKLIQFADLLREELVQ